MSETASQIREISENDAPFDNSHITTNPSNTPLITIPEKIMSEIASQSQVATENNQNDVQFVVCIQNVADENNVQTMEDQDNITENEHIQSTEQMVDLLQSKKKRNKTTTKKNASILKNLETHRIKKPCESSCKKNVVNILMTTEDLK